MLEYPMKSGIFEVQRRENMADSGPRPQIPPAWKTTGQFPVPITICIPMKHSAVAARKSAPAAIVRLRRSPLINSRAVNNRNVMLKSIVQMPQYRNPFSTRHCVSFARAARKTSVLIPSSTVSPLQISLKLE